MKVDSPYIGLADAFFANAQAPSVTTAQRDLALLNAQRSQAGALLAIAEQLVALNATLTGIETLIANGPTVHAIEEQP